MDTPSLRLHSRLVLGCVKLTIEARHHAGLSDHITFLPLLALVDELVESQYCSCRLASLCLIFVCYFI